LQRRATPISAAAGAGALFRHWTGVRHRDAAERALLTAIASGASAIELAVPVHADTPPVMEVIFVDEHDRT
jgi:hypothetical protein